MVRGVRPGRVALASACVLVGLWLVLPTLVAVPVSFTPVRSFAIPSGSWSTEWYSTFFSDSRWLAALQNSLVVAAWTTVVATSVGTLAALAIDRARWRGMAIVSGSMLAPIIVPLILLGPALFYVFLRWGLVGTVAGLVIAHSVTALPLVIQPVLASLAKHDRTLEQAAASLGAPPIAVMWQVVLPQIRPGVLSGAVFAFIWSFDEIVISVFLTSPDLQTLPVLMFNAVTQVLDPTIAAASTMILAFTTTLILLALKLGGKEMTARGF